MPRNPQGASGYISTSDDNNVSRKTDVVTKNHSGNDEPTAWFRGSGDEIRPVESAFAANKRARDNSKNYAQETSAKTGSITHSESETTPASPSTRNGSTNAGSFEVTAAERLAAKTNSIAKKVSATYQFRPPMHATIVRANLSDTRGSEDRPSFAAEPTPILANSLETVVEVAEPAHVSSAGAPLSSGSSSVVIVEPPQKMSELEQLQDASVIAATSSLERAPVVIVEDSDEEISESPVPRENDTVVEGGAANQHEQRPVDIATPPLSDDGKHEVGSETSQLDKNMVDLTQDSAQEDITPSQGLQVSPKRPGTVVLSRKMANSIGKPSSLQSQETSYTENFSRSLGRKRRVHFTRFDDYIILCTMSNKQGHILSYQEYVSLLLSILPQHSMTSIRNRIKELISNALLRQAAVIEDKTPAVPLLREFGDKCAKEYDRRLKKETMRLKDMFPIYQNLPILKVSRWVDFYRLDLISLEFDWSDFYSNERIEAGLAELGNENIQSKSLPDSEKAPRTTAENVTMEQGSSRQIPDVNKSAPIDDDGDDDNDDEDLFRDSLAEISDTRALSGQVSTVENAGKSEDVNIVEQNAGVALENQPTAKVSDSNSAAFVEIIENNPHTPLNQRTSANPWSSSALISQKLKETVTLSNTSTGSRNSHVQINTNKSRRHMRKERTFVGYEEDSSDEGMFRDDITKSVLNQEPKLVGQPSYRTPSPGKADLSRLKRRREPSPQFDKSQNESDDSPNIRGAAEELFETAPEIAGSKNKAGKQQLESSAPAWHISGGSPEPDSVVDETRQLEADEEAETDDQFEIANSESEDEAVDKPKVTITRKRNHGIYSLDENLRRTLAQRRASSFITAKPAQTTLSSPFNYEGVSFGHESSSHLEEHPTKRSRHSDTAFIKRRLLGSPKAKGSDDPVADALYNRLRNVPGGDKLPELINKLTRLFPDANKLDHLEALYSTTLDLTNAVDILFALQDNTSVPSKKGIWTSNDDMVLMHGVGGRMASFMLGEKHGYDGVIKREEFLKAMETPSF